MLFSCFNRNIPDEAHTKIGEMGSAGVQVFAFTPSGGWVIVTNTGLFARNIPDECYQKLIEFRNAGHLIRVVAFPPEGGNSWVIVTNKTYFARNIADECYQKIGEFWSNGSKPTCVAFPYPGGNRWVILADRAVFARNIDDECYQKLVNFSQGLRPAQRVAFTKSGGWVILARDRYFARGIPDECYEKMGAFTTDKLLVDHVNFAPNGGWSIMSNTARTNLALDPLRAFEDRMAKVANKWESIWGRMAALKVPGVSVAVVRNNNLAWACSYGVVEQGGSNYVHTDTAFQAASLSKPVSAMGFMRQVQDGRLTLDENINPKLGWTLPRRACVSTSWQNKVTLRRLLTHSGGVIGRDATFPTDRCSNFDDGGGGFGGYANTAGVGVPTLDEILAGVSARPGVSVNSPKIEICYDPGTMSPYSGHGYMVLMKMLETQTGKTFAAWMRDNILKPLGMNNSTFSLTAPKFSGPPSSGHKDNGHVIAGKYNRYPELPAAGLYTTPSDLCRFIMAINQDGTLNGKTVLDATRTQAMRENGVGLPVGNVGQQNQVFSHGGSNYGFRCAFWGFPSYQAGIAVMTNSENGGNLGSEIKDALVRTYGWT